MMALYLGFGTLVVLLGAGWWLYSLRQRVDSLAARVDWYESLLRRAGIRVDDKDYIQYCLINEGRARALAEYVRLYGVSLDEARRELLRIEAELRDA
jgi:hypothetical protein